MGHFRGIVVGGVVGLAGLCAQASVAAPVGSLTQLSGMAGCVSFDGTGGACQAGRSVEKPESLAISHDGKFAYGSSYSESGEDALTAYRIGRRGGLTQLPGTAGCFTNDGKQDGTAGVCTAGRAIGSGDGTSIVISPDDRFVYAVNQNQSAETGVAVFRRNRTTGVLTQLGGSAGCVEPLGSASGGCASGRILTGATGIAMSPDSEGRFVYVSSYDGDHRGLAIFARNAHTGVLTQLSGPAGCLSNDGASELVGHPCRQIRGITADSSPEDPVISADGRNLYFSAYEIIGETTTSAVIAFSRNRTTGKLAQLPEGKGCLTDSGTGPNGEICTKVRALDGAYEETISPDGRNLYVGAWSAEAIVVLRRRADGSLAQLPGKLGCVSADGSSHAGPGTCAVGRGVGNQQTPAVSPDGRNVYVTSYASNGALSVFSRNPSTGALTQLPGPAGCFTNDGTSQLGAHTCTAGRALAYGYDAVVSPNGRNVYVAGDSTTAGGFAVFSRVTLKPRCSGTAVARGRVSKFLASGLPAHLTCNEAVSVRLTLAVTKAVSHGFGLAGGRIASGKRSSASAGKLTVRLRFTRRARQRLGAADPSKLPVTLNVRASDLAGNQFARRVRLTLK
jgi:6-phosphogluconolactonase (cycloisomerase 2 family)